MRAAPAIALLTCFLFSTSAWAVDPGEPAMPAWLAGAWAMESESGAWSEEWWTPPRADQMMGAGRSGKGSSLGWWEHMRIERNGGKLSFCAIPKGQAGACFDAVSSGESAVVFENPGHDYPQRVRYWRDGDYLNAEVSLLDGSRPNRWRFRKVG